MIDRLRSASSTVSILSLTRAERDAHSSEQRNYESLRWIAGTRSRPFSAR